MEAGCDGKEGQGKQQSAGPAFGGVSVRRYYFMPLCGDTAFFLYQLYYDGRDWPVAICSVYRAAVSVYNEREGKEPGGDSVVRFFACESAKTDAGYDLSDGGCFYPLLSVKRKENKEVGGSACFDCGNFCGLPVYG
jgi:hypothetical protein